MTAVLTGLRPMTDAEREAAVLYLQKEPIELICERTALTRAQVAAAVDLSRLWAQASATTTKAEPAQAPAPRHDAAVAGALAKLANNDATPALPAPQQLPAVDFTADLAEDGLEPLPEPAATEPTIEALLTRAEASPQPRVREIAADVRRQVAHLTKLLGDDEKIRVLTISIEVLRRQLDKDEAELAELLGDAPPTPEPPTPAAPPKAAKAPPSTRPHATPGNGAIRAWARQQGLRVAERGAIPREIRIAYHEAHPEGAS